MDTAKKGDKVKIMYIGKLEDDTVFDQSEASDPLEFIAGSEDILPGISNGVIGMGIGDKKHIVLSPEDAYGQRMPGLEQEVSLEQLPADVKVGDMLGAEIEGQQIVLTVLDIRDKTAILDANHPLAGHTLTFDIEVVGIEAA